MIRVPSAKITQLAWLDLHSRDIDARVLLDSRENFVKRVWVFVNTWNDVYVRFFQIRNTHLTNSCSYWNWREFFSMYIVLNFSKRKFLFIIYWECDIFFSLARLYIFVWRFLYMFAAIYIFIYLLFSSWTFDTFSVERTVHMNVVCLIE